MLIYLLRQAPKLCVAEEKSEYFEMKFEIKEQNSFFLNWFDEIDVEVPFGKTPRKTNLGCG